MIIGISGSQFWKTEISEFLCKKYSFKYLNADEILEDVLNEKYGMNYIVTDNDYVEISNIVYGWEVISKLNDKIPFCDYCSEMLHKFNWEGDYKNDKDIYSYILKKNDIIELYKKGV